MSRPKPRPRPLPLLPLLALLSACAPALDCPPGSVADEDGITCVFDEVAVLDLVRNLDATPLVKVNEDPFDQSMGTYIRRNVYISALEIPDVAMDTVSLYERIDPQGTNAPMAAEFPVGTVIIHEAVDREEGHGVLVKRTPDFENLEGDDWWFGKVYDDGTYDLNACSPCESCHTSGRSGTDGLWGVPRAAL